MKNNNHGSLRTIAIGSGLALGPMLLVASILLFHWWQSALEQGGIAELLIPFLFVFFILSTAGLIIYVAVVISWIMGRRTERKKESLKLTEKNKKNRKKKAS